MVQTIRNAWKIKELRSKLLFTAFIILVVRFGSAIPVPYINPQAIGAVFSDPNNIFFGYINLLSGGAFSNMTIFAMSITPYINASIIIQLLTIAIPALERMVKDGGEEGRKKQVAITRYVTVALGLLQGFVYYISIERLTVNVNGATVSVLQSPNLWKAFVIIAAFTAGTAVIMWLGEQITENGIGNGISIILFAGIVARVPSVAVTAYNNVVAGTLNIIVLILLLIAMIVVIGFVVFMSNAERRLPVQYAKRVIGRKVYGGQTSFIPLKVNMTGVMPIIFASSIVSLPMIIASFFGKSATGFGGHYTSFWDGVLSWLSPPSPVYIILYLLFILGFAFFYAFAQFNPIEISNNIKSNGGFIPGLRPGKPTADFITKVMRKITIIGAAFLGVVAVIPIIVSAFSHSLQGLALGGTTVLIVVGVALDTVKQLESQMLMRHYKGFLE